MSEGLGKVQRDNSQPGHTGPIGVARFACLYGQRMAREAHGRQAGRAMALDEHEQPGEMGGL